jgi:hypothetical protein
MSEESILFRLAEIERKIAVLDSQIDRIIDILDDLTENFELLVKKISDV